MTLTIMFILLSPVLAYLVSTKVAPSGKSHQLLKFLLVGVPVLISAPILVTAYRYVWPVLNWFAIGSLLFSASLVLFWLVRDHETGRVLVFVGLFLTGMAGVWKLTSLRNSLEPSLQAFIPHELEKEVVGANRSYQVESVTTDDFLSMVDQTLVLKKMAFFGWLEKEVDRTDIRRFAWSEDHNCTYELKDEQENLAFQIDVCTKELVLNR